MHWVQTGSHLERELKRMVSRPLPDKNFVEKGKRCKEEKNSKLRVAVAFFVNVAGGKAPEAVVIWRRRTKVFKGQNNIS